MATDKGYTSQTKLDRAKPQHVTVEPIRTEQNGLTVLAHIYAYEVGTDAVEASSTTSVINATAHAALKGDIIRFTSGALSGREVKVIEVAANTITLAEDMPSAPAALVTFQILRHKYPVVNADGTLATSSTTGPIQFVLDGVDTEVEEDTVTPANNRPLPVKLTSVTGDIDITAGDLNIQSDHTGANFDSIRIGDGTETALVDATGNLNVVDATGNTHLSSIVTSVQLIDNIVSGSEAQVDIVSAGPIATEVTLAAILADTASLDTKIIKADTDDVTVTSSALPTGAATEATLASIDGNIIKADTDDVTITGALPAGNNNIGDVDVVSSVLPTGAATEATLAAILADTADIEVAVELLDNAVVADGAAAPSHGLQVAGYDGTNSQYIKTDAAGELQIDVLTQPARSHTTDSIQLGDGTDLALVSAAGELQVLDSGANTTLTSILADTADIETAVELIDNVIVADGAAAPSHGAMIAAYDGANAQFVSADSTGKLNVNVSSVSAAAYDVVDFHDTDPVLDASSSNIPASGGSPLEIVATLAAAVKKIYVADTTGFFIGLYTGAAASEVLQAVINPGMDTTLEVQLAAGERVSVRHMKNVAITTGELCVQFIG